MSDAERYEFQIAAWLHDCGKITSPEYVVDKATKLETLYNRLHEVRMRFEVLWRDADIRYWRGCAEGGEESQLRERRDAEQQALREDFAFVAQANVGGEFMKDEDIERLARIGERRWWRHFDDRIGISHDEAERLAATPVEPLPAEERLLADKPAHQVPWGERKPPVAKDDPRNTWGFDMRLPAFASHYGELYNLGIRRGTLTDEERFKINEHIVQTLMMLSALSAIAAVTRLLARSEAMGTMSRLLLRHIFTGASGRAVSRFPHRGWPPGWCRWRCVRAPGYAL